MHKPLITRLSHPDHVALRVDVERIDPAAFAAALGPFVDRASRDVEVDLTLLSGVNKQLLRVLLVSHRSLERRGHRLHVKATRSQRAEMTRYVQGQLLSYREGASGYEVRGGNRLVLRDTDPAWFCAERLQQLLVSLQAESSDPPVLDLSRLPLELDRTTLLPIVRATLSAEAAGRSVRVHVTRDQHPRLAALGLDRLLTLNVLDPGAVVTERDTIDRDRMEELLVNRDDLPSRVTRREYHELTGGSFESQRQAPTAPRGPRSKQERQPRIQVSRGQIQLTRVSGSTVAGTTLVDISRKGLQIRTAEKMFPDEAVRLRVELPESATPLEAQGRVVWVAEREQGCHAGILMTSIPGATMVKLRRAIPAG